MDALLTEAILQTLRMLTLLTGALVLIDGIGILIRPQEIPPHKPKWAATSWCIVSGTAASVMIWLVAEDIGFVRGDELWPDQLPVWLLYAGLSAGFTCRAISRAHRPLFTVVAVLGMSAAGMTFAVWDLVR